MYTLSMYEIVSDKFQELLFISFFYVVVTPRNCEVTELYSEFVNAQHTEITDFDFMFCL